MKKSMRLRLSILAVLSILAGAVTAALGNAASASPPGNATVTVVHGIPGVPVDVYVNGTDVLPDFTFGTVSPALSLPPGTYAVAVKAAGTSTTLLSATETLTSGENASIVANLDTQGNPTLNVFANPTTPAPAGDAWVLVRHTADAPGVDVYAGTTKVITDLTNPNSAGPLAVPAGTLPVSVAVNPSTPSSTPVIGPVDLPLTQGHVYIAYAIGNATSNPSTLTAVVQSYVVGQARPNSGYYSVGSDGGVYAFGSASFAGSVPGAGVHVNNVVGLAATSDGKGYWVIGSDGGVFAFGDAPFEGSLPGIGVHVHDIVGIAASPDDRGYLLVGSDGGVYAFGDATFEGSVPGAGAQVHNVTGIAATSDGGGYWLVAADGGVFAFGDAPYAGSLPGVGVHAGNVVGIAASNGGRGYWLVGADGGVFAFGDAPNENSLPGLGVKVDDIVGIVAGNSAAGFQLIGSDGGVYALGGAPFEGSLPGIGVSVNNVTGGSAA